MIVLVIFIMTVITAFGSGYFIGNWTEYQGFDPELVHEAYTILSNHAYVDSPGDSQLTYGMIRGLVSAYNDPYTVFVEPVQHELQSNDLSGEFGGIGVRVERNNNEEVILFPFPDSPAKKAQIQDGDRLLRVDDLIVTDDTRLDEIEAEIRGPIGTEVELEISLPGTLETKSVKVIRKPFPIPSVSWNLEDSYPQLGLIKINRISATTPDEVRNAIHELQNQGALYFLLDLRNNSGGLLDGGVKTAGLFLKDGIIIQQQYKNQPINTFNVEYSGEFSQIPLAVLINHDTASAAEIIGGALQAHKRAKIYGQNSFGKDSLQLIFELSDKSSLHVTAAKWWIPDLKASLSENGIIPDVWIEPGNDEQSRVIQIVIEDFKKDS